MPDKDCVITIITHFLFKNWEGNSKYNVDISFNLTSRNHYQAEQAIIIAMPAKISLILAKITLDAVQ